MPRKRQGSSGARLSRRRSGLIRKITICAPKNCAGYGWRNFYRLAKKEGLDARFVQGLSTFSVGDKTSVADYQGKGRGDALMNGDAALMDVVIEVNGEKMDITRSFVVSRTKDGGLQMTGIDYTKKGEEFKKYIDGLGLSRQQKQGHLAINGTLHRILEGLEMGADGERKIKRYEEMTAKAVDIISSHKIGKKFGFWRKIHEVFGEEGAHNFGLGHFQDRSPLKGKIQVGDIINLGPGFISPGEAVFRNEVQVPDYKDGYEIVGSPPFSAGLPLSPCQKRGGSRVVHAWFGNVSCGNGGGRCW